jgi:hypothetical protein
MGEVGVVDKVKIVRVDVIMAEVVDVTLSMTHFSAMQEWDLV